MRVGAAQEHSWRGDTGRLRDLMGNTIPQIGLESVQIHRQKQRAVNARAQMQSRNAQRIGRSRTNPPQARMSEQKTVFRNGNQAFSHARSNAHGELPLFRLEKRRRFSRRITLHSSCIPPGRCAVNMKHVGNGNPNCIPAFGCSVWPLPGRGGAAGSRRTVSNEKH